MVPIFSSDTRNISRFQTSPVTEYKDIPVIGFELFGWPDPSWWTIDKDN